MRSHGWAGNPPADEDAAIRRILDATRTALTEMVPNRIVDVAQELGSHGRPSTDTSDDDELLTATAFGATASFSTDRDHLAERAWTPAEA